MSGLIELKKSSATHSAEASLVVPRGYKRTEAGILPENWIVSTIGSEFKVELGKMLDAAKNVGIPKPYIGNRSVQWGHFDLQDLAEMPMTPADLKRFRLRCNDLLVCEGGEIGRAAVWDDAIAECYYQKALHRLRPKRGYDVFLMMSFLSLWSSTGYLGNYVTQTSIAHLPKDKLETVPLPIPPLPEQQAIIEALWDVDELLRALEALIDKKRAIKQGAMQQLLTGKTRLPGFSGRWRMRRLGELAKIQRGASPRPIDSPVWFDENSSIGWVRISDVTSSGTYLRSTTQKLSQLGVKHSRSVAQGSLIMSICATVGRPIITTVNVCIHDGFVVFERLDIDQLFLYHVLTSIQGEWSKYGQTGSQMNLNTGLINRTEIRVPPRDEQNAIATVLSDIDADIATLEVNREKTRAIKQGMMQQLLTGRIRLVKPQPAEAEA